MKEAPDKFGPEISDRIIAFDPDSLQRLAISRRAVVQEFLQEGNRRAAQIVSRMPVDADGNLDNAAVDDLMVIVHAEIQRLSEEFQQGLRVKALLWPAIEALRTQGLTPPYRIVDIGCGTGFMIRWLASQDDLPDDVQLVGTDYHKALVERARRLAKAENLPCRFEVANAFNLKTPATIFFSIGVIHHFRGADLETFFRQQATANTQMFVHYDIAPTWLAPVGAWIFHQARMREPLSRHDGVLSAIRAHPSSTLVDALNSGAPNFLAGLFDEDRSLLPILKVMHGVVGVRPALRDPLMDALGADARRLEFS